MRIRFFLSLIFVLSSGAVSNTFCMEDINQSSSNFDQKSNLADRGFVPSMNCIPVQNITLHNLCEHSCIPSSPARCNCSCISNKPHQVVKITKTISQEAVEILKAMPQEDEEKKRDETIQQLKCNLLVLKKQVGKTKAIKIAFDQVKELLDSSEEDDTASSGSSPSGVDSDELLEDLKKKKE